MTRLDYTFDRQLALEREDSCSEGLAEGRRKERISLVNKKIARGKSLEQIADELEEDKKDILPIYNVVFKMESKFDVDEAYKKIYYTADFF